MNALFGIILLDLKRLWVDKIRLLSSLAQPLLYLFVLGSGLGASSKLGGAAYLQYIFPGVLGLSLLFSATFAAIAIVFDRQIGFLKAILVAPVPRPVVACGKIASGAIQALIPGLILLLFAPLVGLPLTAPIVLALLGAMLLAAVTFAALGVAVAARFTSVTVFPIVSNAVLLPMFFLSGALYPLTGTPAWLRALAHVDPVAYAVDLMRAPLTGQRYFPLWLSLAVLAAFILVLSWLAMRVFARGDEV